MKTYCNLTHYDLDGVVSGMIAKAIFPIELQKCCGYGKAEPKLKELMASGHDNLVVTDFNLTDELMKDALNHFDTVHYYDHHEPSAEHAQYANVPNAPWNFDYHFTLKLSGTAITYMDAMKRGVKLPDGFEQMVKLTDTYDLWRTDNPLWDDAYILNDLFWRYNFWGFENRFSDGFSGFSSDELQYCKLLNEERHDIIDSAPLEELEDNGMIIMLPNRKALSEVTLFLDQYDYFFIIYTNDEDAEGKLNCSIRARVDTTRTGDEVNINDAVRKCVAEGHLLSGGGHKKAGGCIFNTKDINEVLNIIKTEIFPRISLPF